MSEAQMSDDVTTRTEKESTETSPYRSQCFFFTSLNLSSRNSPLKSSHGRGWGQIQVRVYSRLVPPLISTGHSQPKLA